MPVLLSLLLAALAHAADTTSLAAQRWQANHKISFYCDTGRPVITTSDEALTIRPSRDCSFNGPLNSKLPLKNLQPPFLNPVLSRSQLKSELQARGVAVDSDSGSQLQFHLPSGESFTAQDLPAKSLEDTLLHLGAYPSDWGGSFVSISGGGLAAFQKLAKAMSGSAVFWRNPYAKEEQLVRPRFENPRQHLPLTLQPKCDLGAIADVKAQMLLVGDMHTAPDAQYFLRVLNSRSFAWVALEITRDHLPELNAFLSAGTASEEDAELARVVSRLPSDTADTFKDILRSAKARGMKIVLMDYSEPYFNFPFTDTAFHGAIIGTRNLLWVSQLPSSWSGTGLVFGGLAHFTDTPGADFQNFALERFPGAQMVLVNPLEKCTD